MNTSLINKTETFEIRCILTNFNSRLHFSSLSITDLLYRNNFLKKLFNTYDITSDWIQANK